MARVQLAVYDLSRGMASSMSQPLLGTHVEGIWHTGVVVFGYEYFYGGGLQKIPFGQFETIHGMQPNKLLDLGDTSVTENELDVFSNSLRNRFTAASYDLIRNNCNNYSNELVKYMLNIEIPHDILHLATNVFSTPGGAMIRPLIESMQSSVNQGGRTLDAFGGDMPLSEPGDTAQCELYALQQTSNSRPNSVVDSELKSEYDSLIFQESLTRPIATHCNSPLISNSNDETTLDMVISRIVLYSDTSDSSASFWSEEEVTLIKQCKSLILNAQVKMEANGKSVSASDTESYPAMCLGLLMSKLCSLFVRILSDIPKLHMHCLFLLRALVLIDDGDYENADGTAEAEYLTRYRVDFAALIRGIMTKLNNYGRCNSSASCDTFFSHGAYVLGLCVVANLLAHSCNLGSCPESNNNAHRWSVACLGTVFLGNANSSGNSSDSEVQAELLIDICIRGMNMVGGPSVALVKVEEIHMIGSACLFNLVMFATNHGQGHVNRPWQLTPKPLRCESENVFAVEEQVHPHVTMLLCNLCEDLVHCTGRDSVDVLSTLRFRKLIMLVMLLHAHSSSGVKSDGCSGNDSNCNSTAAWSDIKQLLSDLEYSDALLRFQSQMFDEFVAQSSLRRGNSCNSIYNSVDYYLLADIISYIC